MLMQSIRDRATGWIAWIIVILISIPFALWGIQEYLSPTSNVAVATVNGTDVSIDSFQRTFQRQRMQLQAVLGPNFDFSQLDDERLREEALNQLINEEVLLQAGLSDGMRVGDQQLAFAIQGQQAFHENGVFSQELYEQWLRTQGYSTGGFEFDLRRSILSEQIISGIAASSFVTGRELENAVRLQRQKRRYRTLTVPVEDFKDAPVSDEAIEAHYQANQANYVSPERVKIEYLELSRDAIAETVDVSDEELERLYEQRKSNYRTEEQRDASHILLRLDKDADEAAVAQAREKLETLREQIEAGTPFEDLAREYSQDPGSAKQGGSLGTFGRGVMDPAFESAAFALAEGEVSEPVRSSFGMHLIKVTAIHPSVVKSFEQVKEELRAERQREEAEQIFVDNVERVATLAFEHPESLEVAADILGVTPTVSDWISPLPGSNTGIGADPAVVEAAFSPDVLELGNNSDLIELDGSRVVVLRVAEHEPTKQQDLEEVRDRIRAELGAREARKLAAESGGRLLEALRGAQEAEAVAESSSYAWSEEAEKERTARDVDQAVLRTLFRMPRPAGDDPVYDTAVTSNGDFVIVELAGVTDGELQDVAKAEKDTARKSIAAELGRNDYDAMVKGLRDAASINVYRENL